MLWIGPVASFRAVVARIGLVLPLILTFASGAEPAKAPATNAPAAKAASPAVKGYVLRNAPAILKPLPPAEAFQLFQVPADLKIDQVLTEPTVAQPLFLNFDERGRMWVVQYLQYPEPAGLTVVSHDSVRRAVYNQVPPPPPNHFRGRDKITIHESSRNDGVFDRQRVFLDGLSIATSLERGRGGVWVLNPPYLLFYPDANGDDVPDGDPVVHLAGFGIEDTHSVANSLRWGPDGWLYGAQGSTVSGHILRPGLDREPISHSLGQQIWRYHPESRRFEIFSEGGGNAFGIEIDAKGRILSGHNGGDTRGFHYMQGAYLRKGFEKHGALANPYAFGYFMPMAHAPVDRFTHNFVIYEGGALPAQYVGKLLGIEPLQGRVTETEIMPVQTTFKTRDLSHLVTTQDRWFRPVDIKVGPEGAVYLCDWYDLEVNHLYNYDSRIDREKGRIYRLAARDAKPVSAFNLARLSSAQLVETLDQPNKWFRQTALRLFGDRKDRSVIPALTRIVGEATGQRALEALWALNLSGGLSEATALKTLAHPDPHVRLWTARLLCDEDQVSPAIAALLARMASSESNVEARAQLACSARRLPARDGLAIVRRLLAHDADADDERVPLLLWWAIEAKAESDRAAVIALFDDPAVWNHAIVRRHILERVTRRYAQAGTRADLLACATLFNRSPSREHSQALLSGFEAAFQGRSLTGLPNELLTAMARFDAESVALGLRQAKPEAIARGLETIADEKARPAARAHYIAIVGEARIAAGVPVLLQVLERSREPALRKAALSALQSFEESKIGEQVITLYPKLGKDVQPAAQTLLASRAPWTRRWLEVVESGKIQANSIPPDVVRSIRLHRDPEVARLADKIWGGRGRPTTAEMEQRIQKLSAVIKGGAGNAYTGRTLYQNTCASCHVLLGQGGQVGPDLTSFQRDDVDRLLRNIVNPSAEIREGYDYTAVHTTDGRALSGFLFEQNDQFIVLRGLDGQNVTLDRKMIAKLEPVGVSLMPEGLIDSWSDQQVRDLFAYLRTSQPMIGREPAP